MRSGDACPACEGPLSAWRRVPASEPALAGRRFALRRCTRCGTAVTAEAVPDLHDSGAFRAGDPRLLALARPLLRRFDAERLALLRRLAPPGGRIVDAGAGQGRFVAAARAAGYDAIGLEPARRGLERAAATGVALIPAGIEDAAIEGGSVDAVTVWHVLEHLEDPAKALARMRDWLVPGRRAAPGCAQPGQLAGAGGRRPVVSPRRPAPPHPFHRRRRRGAPAAVAVSPCRRSATGCSSTTPTGCGSRRSIALTERPSYLYNLLKRNAPVAGRDLAVTVAALGLLPVAVAAELVAARARRGGTIAVLARRA